MISLDNGPKRAGRRAQRRERMAEFAAWSGPEVRPVYDPPYHSQDNPIERCRSALEKPWDGGPLNCWEVAPRCALRMRGRGRHPTVERPAGAYPEGVRVPAQEIKAIEARLERSPTLPEYDITIRPRATEPAVKQLLPIA